MSTGEHGARSGPLYIDRRATVAEVKRNPRKFNRALLEEKVQHIKPLLRGYQIEIKGLSLEDM